MKSLHVGMLTLMLGAGCAHHSSTGAHDHSAERAKERHQAMSPDERRKEARENADEEQRAAAAADQLENNRTARDMNTEPNNTRVNERDREASSLTPLDQSEEATDRELTATIRKAMIGDSSLSFTAKNTKIITRDGLVTLRGTVVNAREKETIAKIAQQSAGKGRVVDELEIEE